MRLKKQQKVAFYLSGGGVAAIESIGGMITALDKEWGITPDFVSSCSGGGIPYHLKYSGVELIEFFKSVKVSDYIKMRSSIEVLLGKPVYNTEKLKLKLEELTGYDFNPNHYVNIIDVDSKITYYVPANSRTVLASASIPEVFDSQIVDADGYYYKEVATKKGTTTIEKIESKLASRLCSDGGLSDVIPTPTSEEYDMFDKIFILVCNDSLEKDNISSNRIQRVLGLLSQVMNREYNQVLKDYYKDKKVFILKPPAVECSLLDWSKDYQCYYNSYDYVKQLKLGAR